MNILFITFNDFSIPSFGGGQCTKRNYELLSGFANVTTYIVKKKSNLESALSAKDLFFPPVSNLDLKIIIDVIKNNNIDYIFYDSSLLGTLVKKINVICKKPCITFFHNIEIDYIDVRFGKRLIKLPYKILCWINEGRSVAYSDKIICLSERDRKRILKLYKKDIDLILPITFDDKVCIDVLMDKYNKKNNENERYCLFVGSYIYTNYEAAVWFIQNVTSKIPIKLKIIGKDFEKVKEELTRDNVEVIGTVDNLDDYYINADFVVSPLLDGAGMKVKIAEALMYGKTIFATKESFEGYEIEYDKVGGLCNTAEDFIIKINDYVKKPQAFNHYSRKVFEEKFSTNQFAESIRMLLQ